MRTPITTSALCREAEEIAALSGPTTARLMREMAGRLLDLTSRHPVAPIPDGTVRYCPECGSMGEIEPYYVSCCPDNKAAYVPVKTAEQAMAYFDLKIQSGACLEATALLDRYDEETRALQHGGAVYDWRLDIIRELRTLFAPLVIQSDETQGDAA